LLNLRSLLYQVQADDGDLNLFDAALESVCKGLAEDVVRNGEGTGHVMEVCKTPNVIIS
jgi:N-acetylglutamate synthase/N-acetylornithine aminotransferase